MQTKFRLIDDSDGSVVANAMTYEQAQDTMRLYLQDYPYGKFSIESYSVYSERDLGRDPDLHD